MSSYVRSGEWRGVRVVRVVMGEGVSLQRSESSKHYWDTTKWSLCIERWSLDTSGL